MTEAVRPSLTHATGAATGDGATSPCGRPEGARRWGMAATTRRIDAPPEKVFDVLSNGWMYTAWVVGASHIRAVESEWPAEGSRIHHSFGAWPVMLSDETKVEVSERPHRLVLLARGARSARPASR